MHLPDINAELTCYLSVNKTGESGRCFCYLNNTFLCIQNEIQSTCASEHIGWRCPDVLVLYFD